MRTKALNFPKSLLIETINKCQGECKFCPYDIIRKDEALTLLTKEKFKELIDEISIYNIERITLFNNNEPLLDDRIYEFIHYTKSKLPNTEITLSTNGRILTLDKIIKLYESGLTTLYVSIPVIEKEEYKHVMGVYPDKLLELLKSINEFRLLKMIRIAIPKTKYFKIEDFKMELGKYLLCAWNIEYKESWNIKDKILSIIDCIEYEGPCDRPLDQMVISSNGNVIICCRDWKYQNVIGNVYDNALYEIWHSKMMQDIQRLIIEKDYDNIECCKDCNMNLKYIKRLSRDKNEK